MRERLGRVWANRWTIVQAGAAAGLAWFLARVVFGHGSPFFAPIAAVVVLGGSAGQRLRRTVELVVGVAVGIVVGDLLIATLGTGALQLGVVVALAVAAALFLGSGVLIANQAAASAVLITTLYPPSGGIYYSRWIDALIGGGVGFGVHALIPADPLAAVRKAAHPLLAELADALAAMATALRSADRLATEETLSMLRATEPALRGLTDALANARETVAVAPARWHYRDRVSVYLSAAGHMDHAVRNARVLARRARAALRTGEQVPEGLPAALEELAEAVRDLDRDLAQEREPTRARSRAVTAAGKALGALGETNGLSITVMAAQVRSVAFDLLLASGVEEPVAHELLDAAAA